MNWFQRHRMFSSILLLLTIPTIAVAVVRAPEPEEDEQTISPSELPEVIRNALKGVTISEAETNAAKSVFEIDIEEGEIEIELRLAPDGRLLGIEIEREDDDDGDDDDDEADDEDDE